MILRILVQLIWSIRLVLLFRWEAFLRHVVFLLYILSLLETWKNVYEGIKWRRYNVEATRYSQVVSYRGLARAVTLFFSSDLNIAVAESVALTLHFHREGNSQEEIAGSTAICIGSSSDNRSKYIYQSLSCKVSINMTYYLHIVACSSNISYLLFIRKKVEEVMSFVYYYLSSNNRFSRPIQGAFEQRLQVLVCH
jgi:hypothetical protein